MEEASTETAPLQWWRRNPSMKQAVLICAGIASLLFAVTHPFATMAAVWFAAQNLALVSPMIVLGIVLTAIITANGSMALIAASFKGHEIRMIIVASIIGAITPVCGITVLPLVAGLIIARVPLAPVMAFWLSSPVTDPGMLAITAGTLGMDFAVGKTVSAFGAGILGGVATLLLSRAGYLQNPERTTGMLATMQSDCGSCGNDSQEIMWRFWRDTDRRNTFIATALATGKLMLTWLSVAFIAEYFLHGILPPDLLGRYVGGDSAFAVPLAAIVGAPIYLDGYAALPLIRALIDGGMGTGAAMAFLIAGGIISAWAVIPVFALVRLPVFALYVVLAILSAMLSGWGFAAVIG
jgi:uncharacterized protein